MPYASHLSRVFCMSEDVETMIAVMTKRAVSRALDEKVILSGVLKEVI